MLKQRSYFRTLSVVVALSLLLSGTSLFAQGGRNLQPNDLKAEQVLKSIKHAQQFLVSQQLAKGSWGANRGNTYVSGVTGMVVMALINSGMTKNDPPIKRGLEYLRNAKDPTKVYEVSLVIMALAAAKDGKRDNQQITRLANKLVAAQLRRGENAGSWGYSVGRGEGGGDRSNGQFAILGLRDAAQMGVPIPRETWKHARAHWLKSQSNDGGWGYSGLASGGNSGSMTSAGIATLVITARMLAGDPKKDLLPNGKPRCCGKYEPDRPLERALQWMARNFKKGENPGRSTFYLYYLYAVERAGRLSGHRFFGKHDWYREVAAHLITHQSQRNGSWKGVGGGESDEVVGTSFALLFLSKGLAPVLVHKLKYGSDAKPNITDGDWNRHHDDIRNLVEHISSRPKWPKLLTWQTLELKKVVASKNLQEMLQAPVLLIAGSNAPEFTEKEILLLRDYVEQGGFIFAVRNCAGAEFDKGIRDVVERMYPDEEDARLKRLTAEHPIFRSEVPLNAETVELYGLEYGCRTSIVYSPDDISCLWDKWVRQDPPSRPASLKGMITRATRIGVNVIAYATGREPPNKLQQHEMANQEGAEDEIERGLLQIAKIRHSGSWDVAPRALRNLLMAMNKKFGLAASTKLKNLPASDPNLYNYPVIYMHGRNQFSLSKSERERLKKYLKNGGFLFADSCCGAKKFDESFRKLVEELYPKKLHKIPIEHEIFSTKIGDDIRRVQRRSTGSSNKNVALNTQLKEVEPFLEGVKVDGHYAIIYSKYDISCALEGQASSACAGYTQKDATRIAINIVRYAMLQDIHYEELLDDRKKIDLKQ